MQYQLIYSVWILSFRPEIVETFAGLNIVATLSDVLNNTNREKLNRIVLAVFRNLLEKSDDNRVARYHCASMITTRVPQLLRIILSHYAKADPDYQADLEYVDEQLKAGLIDLSSFDLYEAEVRSGR